MEILDNARRLRTVIEKAAQAGLEDDDALAFPTLFPNWSGEGISYYGPNDPNGVQSKVRYESTLYKCVTSHTSQETWAPNVAASLWARMDDPAIEFPIWVQPIGGTDAYAMGAKVTHNGKKWVNIHGDGNVWEPGVYGWEEVV